MKKGLDLEGNDSDEKLNLVPSRWSHTGWKYQAKDPSQDNYFRNPNRVNQFGEKLNFGQKKDLNRETDLLNSRKSLLGRVLAKQLKIKGGEGNTENSEHFKTMNMVNYTTKNQEWRDKYKGNIVSPRNQDQILWSGEMHDRQNFKK